MSSPSKNQVRRSASSCPTFKGRADAIALLQAFGLKVDELDTNSPTWDGRVLHIARITTTGNLLHELAHFLVAAKRRQRLPNWGLGMDPDKGPRVPCVLSDEQAQHEEVRCALLGVLLASWYGFDWRAHVVDVHVHLEPDDSNHLLYWTSIAWLGKKGLLPWDLRVSRA